MNNAKTAIYSRVACVDDDRIEQQEQRLLQFAEENGYGDCACFRDNGEKGLSLDRPGIQKLIGEIRDGKIKTVTVYDLSRIARGLALMDEWFMIIKEYGVELISVKDNYRFPDDGYLFGVLELLRKSGNSHK